MAFGGIFTRKCGEPGGGAVAVTFGAGFWAIVAMAVPLCLRAGADFGGGNGKGFCFMQIKV